VPLNFFAPIWETLTIFMNFQGIIWIASMFRWQEMESWDVRHLVWIEGVCSLFQEASQVCRRKAFLDPRNLDIKYAPVEFESGYNLAVQATAVPFHPLVFHLLCSNFTTISLAQSHWVGGLRCFSLAISFCNFQW